MVKKLKCLVLVLVCLFLVGCTYPAYNDGSCYSICVTYWCGNFESSDYPGNVSCMKNGFNELMQPSHGVSKHCSSKCYPSVVWEKVE